MGVNRGTYLFVYNSKTNRIKKLLFREKLNKTESFLLYFVSFFRSYYFWKNLNLKILPLVVNKAPKNLGA